MPLFSRHLQMRQGLPFTGALTPLSLEAGGRGEAFPFPQLPPAPPSPCTPGAPASPCHIHQGLVSPDSLPRSHPCWGSCSSGAAPLRQYLERLSVSQRTDVKVRWARAGDLQPGTNSTLNKPGSSSSARQLGDSGVSLWP